MSSDDDGRTTPAPADRDARPDPGGATTHERPRRSWRATVTRWTHGVERRLDRARHVLKRPFLYDPLLVEPYLGYGDASRVRVRARVLEDRGLGPAGADDGPLTNLRNAWRRFDSDEVPGARVRVRPLPAGAGAEPAPGEGSQAPGPAEGDGPGEGVVAVADDEGFVDVDLPLPAHRGADAGEVVVEFELLDPLPRGQERTRFRGEALLVPPGAPYGVISDVDDTVLVTGARRLREVVSRTLLQNARERLPFPGVAALYRAFEAAGAPLFYVSSSPWNLYAPLAEFLDLNDLPLGPLLLRDWGITATELLPLGHGAHKREQIDAVFDAFPELSFLLVGDSGQEDPEIYAEIVRRHPDRVVGVIIRHVADEARARAVGDLTVTLAAAGVPFHLVTESAEAARHAEEHGWIDARAREAVEREVAASGGPPTDGSGARV